MDKVRGEIKAFCYLYREGDEKNKALLTDEKFYVIHNKRIFEFQVENITNLSVNLRKLMLPLIIGGILSSFSLIAIFKDIFNPYVVLITLLSGLLALYTGWTGQWNFTVETRIKEYDFSIPSITDNLKVFIDFFNQFKFQAPQIFLVVPKSWWRQPTNDQEWIELPERPCKGYTLEQLDRIKGQLKGKVILHIDPYKAGAEIKFIKDEVSLELHPFIMNDLNRTAIFKTEVIP